MSELYEYYGKVKWSWKNYIPVGHLTMIAGVQGQGKSYFAAYIMSVWTGAQAKWPDGQKYDGPVGRVALIDTEQMRGEYVNRLRKMGVEDEDVVVPLEEQGSDDLTYSIDLTSELRTVEEMVSRLHCVGIVIDSLSGGHNLNENSDEMKQILKPLADMAARRQVPAIVIHDIRKKDEKMSNRATLDRVRGSVVITKFCRSVLGLYRPAEDLNSAVRIDVLKANFCKVPKSLGFTIGSEGLTFCKAPEEVKSMTATDYAAEFLLTQLAEGPRKIKVVRATAKADGITNYALFEAKRRLDVVTLKDKWALRTIDGKTYPVSSRAVEDAG